MADLVNYLGKLMELGQKCKFVVDPEVTSNFTSNTPAFTCTLRIPMYDIVVEQTGTSKRSAKAAAAQIAFEKIIEKIDESNAASIDRIALKLKDLKISSDSLDLTIEFAKKMASIDVSKVVADQNDSYIQLKNILSEAQCDLTYRHGEHKTTDGSIEHHFNCQVRPSSTMSPVISGWGWSLENAEEAKIKAVNQLLAVLKAYSTQ